jgi:hypothetical protein
MLGNVYRAAMAAYLCLSLPSLVIAHEAYSEPLFSALRTALPSPRLTKFMLWPLIVAGVAAIDGGAATKYWVERSLEDMGRTVGSIGPGKAGQVLREYWRRGVEGWDSCFERPYVFVV